MKRLEGVLVLAASVILAAACAGTSGGPSSTRGAVGPLAPPTCNPPEKQVTLNQVTISGSTATVKVDPSQRDIPSTGGGIRWKFASNQFSFTSDGINFDKPNNPPSGPSAAGIGSDPSQYVVCFGNTTSLGDATWRYNIKFFVNTAPATVWTCDPTIVNRSGGITSEAPLTVNCTRQ